ncbi:thioredoxin domain-containing protein [Rubrobacter xylanophilus]|uniref:Thioredoxin domain-containing protein n=1 Tax=Rubrobacter xylanophilus TaxID=49319 RepID=A0A510HMR2_9ACTN|nr:thioredoxin domain-containing protein [Rubrobacter xylanophilus]BBL79873.1 thioredoxin domain-containing protein [Rubrobacter xylanophilus]
MANRLANETSPYLLQHKDNPVDWYPWGEEAFQRARREDKPILLSVGYSSCHWCHVMERESFEDEETARIMNEHFVNVKVDREERPDIDSIYMSALQAMTRSGGWPMTVFLTPEGVPFYAGTYFPPEPRGGMPSFRQVLLTLADAYRNRREEVLRSAESVRRFLEASTDAGMSRGALREELLDGAAAALLGELDRRFGGFGEAPKFPQPMSLEVLLRHHRRTGDAEALSGVELTLRAMARGGIYDQLGGGFHRYAVDWRWLVPHFEKMLYDNALLSRLYLEAYQVTGNGFYRRIAEETLDYVTREMRSPEGGFYSAEDADSEGEEGKFYVWTPRELREVLGEEDASLAAAYWGVTERGNFEGRNILHVPREPEEVAREFGLPVEELGRRIHSVRRRLLEARARRVRPGRDEKVLAAWNGLMLRSFAFAARVLRREDYLDVARGNAAFLLEKLLTGEGRLLRSYRDGRARVGGYLEDYAMVADGLLALYEATFEARWLHAAVSLTEAMNELFWDGEREAFFDVPADHEELVTRPRDVYDNATPSGTSVAVDVLLRLGLLLGREDYRRRAEAALEGLSGLVERAPAAFGRLLGALDFHLGRPREVVIVGRPGAPDTRALVDALYSVYLPNRVIAGGAGDGEEAALIPLLEGRTMLDGRATAYVCEGYVCKSPTTEPAELVRQLREG